jgi:hypothetical protein
MNFVGEACTQKNQTDLLANGFTLIVTKLSLGKRMPPSCQLPS